MADPQPALPPEDADDAAYVESILPALTDAHGQAEEVALAKTLLERKFGNGSTLEARRRATIIIAMKLGGMRNYKIAKMLGMGREAVRMVLYRARKAGRLNDVRVDLECDLAPLAVESLRHHLKAKDKDVTLKTMQGLGYFKAYSNNKTDGSASGSHLPPLQVNVLIQQGTAGPLPGEAADHSEAVIGVARVDEEGLVDAGH